MPFAALQSTRRSEGTDMAQIGGGAQRANDGCYCRGDHKIEAGLGGRRSPRSRTER
jgi:hypothetical protein